LFVTELRESPQLDGTWQIRPDQIGAKSEGPRMSHGTPADASK